MPSLTTSQKVAIAVTVPLAAVVVYFLIKWSREDAEEIDNFAEENQAFATSSVTVLEVRVPQFAVGAIIGRGGCNIKAIQKDTQTKINFKDNDEDSDGENMSDEAKQKEKTRILLIRGPREKAKNAEVLIRKVIAEQPVVQKTTMDIPQRAIGRIIGKGGKTIRQLCRISGAKIKVDRDDGEGAMQTCEIIGSQSQIDYAKELLYEKINEDNAFKTRKASQDNETKDNLSFVTLPTDGDYFGVYVSGMESPGRFWIQVVTKDSQQLDELVEEMTVFYGDQGQGYAVSEPKVGDLCCTSFQYDKSWYRGRITNILSTSDVQIHYLDFGDSERLPISSVKELGKKYCQLPFQAVECQLANIKPIDGEWDKKSCDIFEKLSCCAEWKVLMARIVSLNNNVAAIELFNTIGEKDVNIEEELIKQSCALYINTSSTVKDEGVSESPQTPTNSPSSKVNEETTGGKEEPITFQENIEQYQSFQFSDESSDVDDSQSFEFQSHDTNMDRSPGSQDVIPLNSRQPVDEPVVSAVEQTVVSCADISQLSTLLNFEGALEDSGELAGDNGTTADPLSVSDESPVALEEKTLPSADISNGDVIIEDFMALSDTLNPLEASPEIKCESLPDQLLVSDVVVHEQYTVSSEPPPGTYSEEVIETPTESDSQEISRDASLSLENEPKFLASVIESSGPENSGNEMIPWNPASEVVEISSNIETTVEKEEADGKTISSPSAGPQQRHSIKSGKRFLAANFNQLPRKSNQEESEEDDDDDDDSLYLSAREDTDSTGFVSAQGSSIDLHTSDSESDVTPSGYLSDTDEELNGNDEMNYETKLDDTLRADKPEPYEYK